MYIVLFNKLNLLYRLLLKLDKRQFCVKYFYLEFIFFIDFIYIKN